MQQLSVDYNEMWAGVTRLESVQMTAAITAKLDLKLWRIDFVGVYLNSLTKEDIYMKQPEGFVKPGFEDHVCKLIHTYTGQCKAPMTGTKHSPKRMKTLVTLHPVPIRVSNTSVKMGDIPLPIPTPMTCLGLPSGQGN